MPNPQIVRESVGGDWQTKYETPSGGGGSQPPTPFNQDDDPGAVGPGAIWTTLTDDPMKVYVRNAADDDWNQVYPAAVSLAAVLNVDGDADGGSIDNLSQLTAGTVTGLDDPANDGDAVNLGWTNGHVGNLALAGATDGVLTVGGESVGSPSKAAFVANGSTVDQLRDSLIAAGFMEAS